VYHPSKGKYTTHTSHKTTTAALVAKIMNEWSKPAMKKEKKKT
jgi:hypothetical protein